MTDAVVLAYTKLRVHRVRTGVTVAIAGMLFGFLLFAVVTSQGVFNSLDRFREMGLNNRYVVSVTDTSFRPTAGMYELLEDEQFIKEVEAKHTEIVTKKKQAAARHTIVYDAASEDPSPVTIDTKTGKKMIGETAIRSAVVQAVAADRAKKDYKPFSIKEYVAPYKTATLRGMNTTLQPANGTLAYMKLGKEQFEEDKSTPQDGFDPTLMILDSSVAAPFVTESCDAKKGEIPVIIPYGQAEKLLGYEKLNAKAPTEEKYQRLADVRRRIGEITASFCYRNVASQQLLAAALMQQSERKQNSSGEYQPTLQYAVPDVTSCGAVVTEKDTRTLSEKQYAERYRLYQQEIGTYEGEPMQYKVTIRGVGISSDSMEGGSFSVAQVVTSLLSSQLGYGAWVIPEDLLQKVDAAARPAAIFEKVPSDQRDDQFYRYESYLVEFGDKQEARQLLEKSGMLSGSMEEGIYTTPFGSGSLVADEMQTWATRILLWLLLGISVFAALILAGIIGRTVSDGRKESAVFRAIGAQRSDIARIYSMYTVLLSLRIIVFAALLGGILAGITEWYFWEDATLGARLAYAATEDAPSFHFIGLNSWYIAAIAGMILIAGLLASVLPILRNIRRNPIQDMRDD